MAGITSGRAFFFGGYEFSITHGTSASMGLGRAAMYGRVPLGRNSFPIKSGISMRQFHSSLSRPASGSISIKPFSRRQSPPSWKIFNVGLGLATAVGGIAFFSPVALLDTTPASGSPALDTATAGIPASSETRDPPPPPPVPPQSDVTLGRLGLGTVLGICTGVFMKKGLRFVAVIVGAGWVLVQYLSSRNLLPESLSTRNSFSRLSSSWESYMDRHFPPDSSRKTSRLGRIWVSFVDFVAADVPSRGTFLCGIMLGLRVG